MTAPTDRGANPGFIPPGDPALDLSRSPFPPRLAAPGGLTILDITKYFGDATGGIRTYLLSKAAYVQRHPPLRQVLVVPGPHDGLAEADGVRCYRLKGPRIPFDQSYRFLLASRTTRRILDHERPDLVEIGSPWLVPWITRRANRRLGAPLVWFYHTHFPRIIAPPGGTTAARRALGQAAWRYVRRVAGICRGVLVASEAIARELQEHEVPGVRRVSLGVDLELFAPTRRADAAETRRRHGLPDAPLAVYLGRFTEEKQLELVLHAWKEVERRTGAWLVFVGAGPREARLRALAEGRQVRFVPYVRDREEVARILAAAELYVAPGPAESFGLSALEAMASGTPVLSVNAGGAAERVQASGAGALYEAGDAGACAEAALTLLRSDRQALGQAARTWAVQHHDWSRAFDGIVAAYRELLAAGGR